MRAGRKALGAEGPRNNGADKQIVCPSKVCLCDNSVAIIFTDPLSR